MRIDFNEPMQISTYFDRVANNLYTFVKEKQDTPYVRILGVGVGILCSLIRLVQIVFAIVEPILKALVNIIGAPCTRQLYCCRGLRFLLSGVTTYPLIAVILGSLMTLKQLFLTPIAMSCYCPNDYINKHLADSTITKYLFKSPQ